jgi:hypothetical protein
MQYNILQQKGLVDMGAFTLNRQKGTGATSAVTKIRKWEALSGGNQALDCGAHKFRPGSKIADNSGVAAHFNVARFRAVSPDMIPP